MTKPCLILGTGGHARVIFDTLQQLNHKDMLGFVDKNSNDAYVVQSLPVLSESTCLTQMQPKDVVLLNGVGGLPGMDARQMLFDKWHIDYHFEFLQLIHPQSYVSSAISLSHGIQIMARACVQTGCHIAENVLINTGAIIDHDCRLEKHVVIAPGAVICGNVRIGSSVYIGANATILQGLTIGTNSVIAAGAVVVNDVPPNTMVRGVPARETKDGQLAQHLSQTPPLDPRNASCY